MTSPCSRQFINSSVARMQPRLCFAGSTSRQSAVHLRAQRMISRAASMDNKSSFVRFMHHSMLSTRSSAQLSQCGLSRSLQAKGAAFGVIDGHNNCYGYDSLKACTCEESSSSFRAVWCSTSDTTRISRRCARATSSDETSENLRA